MAEDSSPISLDPIPSEQPTDDQDSTKEDAELGKDIGSQKIENNLSEGKDIDNDIEKLTNICISTYTTSNPVQSFAGLQIHPNNMPVPSINNFTATLAGH